MFHETTPHIIPVEDIQYPFTAAPEYPSYWEQYFMGYPRSHYPTGKSVVYYDEKFINFVKKFGLVPMVQNTTYNVFINFDEKVVMSINNRDAEDADVDKKPDLEFTVSLDYMPSGRSGEYFTKFFKEFSELLVNKPMTNDLFYMIAQSSGGLYNQKTTCKALPIKDDRYDLYYGEKFPHENLVKFILDENTDNLLLLHGDPGTGKSNYIKNLIAVSEKPVIYIPPSMVSVIADPQFVNYMLSNKDSILLIEDAEQILSKERNSATNNLLGLTDGFLKDAMNLKVICTFNCDISGIDDALLRKGRLHFEYKFRKLTVDECYKLAEFHQIENFSTTEELTLSEFFNKSKQVSVENSFEERKIGFF